MKNILVLSMLLLAVCTSAQEVLEQQLSIEVRDDSLYYFKNIQVIDNGTSYPDTVGSASQFLGDSIQAAQFLKNKAIEGQQTKSAYISRAFERVDFNRSYSDYKSLFQNLTNTVLEVEISKDYVNLYLGVYKIVDPDNSINFFAELIQLNNGRYRLRQLTSQNGEWDEINQWTVTPRSRNNFFLIDFNGLDVEFHRDRLNKSLFYPTGRVDGSTGGFRIKKIR